MLTDDGGGPVGQRATGRRVAQGHGGRQIGFVEAGLARQQTHHGPVEAQGIEGLDHPPLGACPPGQEHVGTAIQEHEDRYMRGPAPTLLEAQIHADRHPSHRAHLQVDDDQIGRLVHDGTPNRRSRGNLTHGTHAGGKGRPNLVPDRLRIAGNENVGHPGEGSARRSWVPLDEPAGANRASEGYCYKGPGGSVLDIQVAEGSGYTLCRPVGELDAYTVGQFRESLGELASKPKLLIDMSQVPFVDSAGLGALIGGIRRAREGGGNVAVCCNRPTLVRLLHTTGFDRIVTVAETVEEAAASLADDQPSST